MRYSHALALLAAFSFTFSSEGFRLRQTGGYDVAVHSRPDIETPSQSVEEADVDDEEHDGQNDEELSFVQEDDAEDEGDDLEDPEESSFEEEGDDDYEEQGDDEESSEQEVVDDEAEPDDVSSMTPVMLQTRANSSHRVAAIPLKLENCGDAKTLGRMTAMTPKSVEKGVNAKLTLSGTVKRTVPGGTLDLTVKLTGFPYSTLGSLKKADICKDHKLDLYVGPVKGGTLTLKAMKCPIKKGKVKYTAYLKLKKSNAAKVSIRAKHKSSKLLCTNIMSGR